MLQLKTVPYGLNEDGSPHKVIRRPSLLADCILAAITSGLPVTIVGVLAYWPS